MKSIAQKTLRWSAPTLAANAARICSLVACLLVAVAAIPAGRAQAQSGTQNLDMPMMSQLNLDFPGMQQVKAAVERNDLRGAQQAYLEYRRSASPAKFTVMPTDMPAAAASNDDPAGDEVLRHHIHNSKPTDVPPAADMGQNFDWTFNPVPKNSPQYSTEWTAYVARTFFWKTLADAYWKTHDERYAQEWVAELNDFAVKNPRATDGANYRPQLWSSLDASIRMYDSWPYTYYHMLNSRSFTPQAEWTYLVMMHEHGIRLETSLSVPNRTGNWVTSECYGLFALVTLFPEMKDSLRWRQFALDRISVELNRMVPPDGLEAELTPSYHFVTLNEFLGPLQLAKLNNAPVPDNLQTKIMSMYRALVIIMAQNGDVVSTNDSNNTNAVASSRVGLKLAYDPLLDWCLSGGKSGTGLPNSTMLPYAGFYTMRGGWKPNDLFLFFRAGPTGIGHEHEDMLEVVMKDYGKTLLLDPGTSSYDSSNWRRFIIGTESHNTITIDGKWQHRGPSDAQLQQPVTNPWVTTPLFDFVSGTYAGGYQQSVYVKKQYQPQNWVGSPDRSATHTRRVLYLRPYYALLLDTVDGSGSHAIDSRFDVQAPSVRIDPGSQAAFSENTDNVQIGLYPLDRDRLNVEVVQGQHGAPDINWGIPTVVFHKQQTLPATFATFLYPYQGSIPDFVSGDLTFTGAGTGSGVWGQSLHTAREDAEVVLVKSGNPVLFSVQSRLFDPIAATASGLVARRAAGRQAELIGGWGITSLSTRDLQFRTDAPASLVVSVQSGHPLFLNSGDRPVRVTLEQPFSQTVTLSPSNPVELDSNGSHPIGDPSLLAMPPGN